MSALSELYIASSHFILKCFFSPSKMVLVWDISSLLSSSLYEVNILIFADFGVYSCLAVKIVPSHVWLWSDWLELQSLTDVYVCERGGQPYLAAVPHALKTFLSNQNLCQVSVSTWSLWYPRGGLSWAKGIRAEMCCSRAISMALLLMQCELEQHLHNTKHALD